jgi:recombinational DNA repair protein RecT
LKVSAGILCPLIRMDNKAWLRLLFSVIKQLLKYAPMKSKFQKAVSMDETIKAKLSVDMSEVQSQEVIEAEFTEQAA